jgi:hypothetical protein
MLALQQLKNIWKNKVLANKYEKVLSKLCIRVILFHNKIEDIFFHATNAGFRRKNIWELVVYSIVKFNWQLFFLTNKMIVFLI